MRCVILLWGEKSSLAHEGMDGIAVFDYNDIVDMGQKCRKVMLDSHDASKLFSFLSRNSDSEIIAGFTV